MKSVILCGGSGTRLWPLSRKNFPKQFLSLYGEKSLLQETYLRMREIMPQEDIYFITNKENFFNVFNQLKELDKNFDKTQIMTEPMSLNTAPAISYTVKYLLEKANLEATEPIIFLPADHYIGKREGYLSLVKSAMEKVKNNIGTIGITPTKPETGYGYIRKGETADGLIKVKEFKEKPDLKTAEAYIASHEYVWNSGMYIFNARTFEEELREHASEIYKYYAQGFEAFEQQFPLLPNISIDYAISEKSKRVVVFEGEFGWSDIGSFDALAEVKEKNGDNKTRLIKIDSKNVFAHSDSDRLIAAVGVDDLVIVENSDTILVHKRGRGEDVKKVVEKLKQEKKKEVEHNLIVHRPWGKYEIVLVSPTHQVKRLTVYPGEKLSLQAHYHRVEHWIVVKGIAKIVNGEKELFLSENQSTFIPIMATHRLENPGRINLELIEVQTGNYLEEDDIIRYEDVYNRIA